MAVAAAIAPCALLLLPLAQSVLLCLEYGIEQIVEHCFFADQNVCRYHHARNNRQGFVVVDNGVFLGAYLYKADSTCKCNTLKVE